MARAIYENRHRDLQNCWAWDDSGLDDEHPGARERVYRDADAALTVAAAICRERCAEIRSRGHLTDSDAESAERERRALVAFDLAEIFEGKGDRDAG